MARTPGAGRLWWSTLPAVAVAAWLVLSAPLPAIGWVLPLATLLSAMAALAVAGAVAMGTGGGVPAREPAPRWPGLAVLVLVVAFGALSALTHAEHVVLRRDAGAYALIGHWLATHGRLTVPDVLEPVGGVRAAAELGVSATSPAFYAAGADLMPQFLVGPHLLHAAAAQLGGWTGVFLAPALLGALALAAFGGLVSRLVGPGWAPLAVAALGLSAPVLHSARSTYSETLALLLLLAGLCLVVDSREETIDPPARRIAAFVGGALLGLGTLVRVDVLRDVALLVPLIGVLAVHRDRMARPLAAGLGLGAAAGAAAALTYSRPYLADLAPFTVPLAVTAALLVVLTAVVAARLRRGDVLIPSARPPRSRLLRALPALAAGGVSVALLALASRPLWTTDRGDPDSPGARVVAGLQAGQGLPIDGGRTYAEHSVAWLSWYAGWPAALFAAAAAAGLVAGVLRGGARGRWAPVLAVLVGSAVLTLWRPAITPDHPWADRRLVPAVLPATVLLATWAVARLARVPRAGLLLGAAGAVAVLVPPALASGPVLLARTEVGEPAAVRRACSAFADRGDRSVAVLVDGRAAREWPAPLRGLCGVRALTVSAPTAARVAAVVRRITSNGGAPVLVAAEGPGVLRRLTRAAPEHVVHLVTREDARLLTRRPDATVPLSVDLWVASRAKSPGRGA